MSRSPVDQTIENWNIIPNKAFEIHQKETARQAEEATQQDIKELSGDKKVAVEIAKFVEDFKGQVRDPLFGMSQVIMSEDTRRQVEILLSRLSNHDFLYKTWGLEKIDPYGKKTAINFYGAPGTGKTMLAEALAGKLGRKIIDVNYATIESMYVGETGKRIQAAFAAAQELDALLFFDEADSILGKRLTNVTQSADQAVNNARAVMLKALDSFSGIVIFATNLAKNFDVAFVRRILQHIHISLPDKEARFKIWQQMIPEEVDGRTNLDWEKLAEKSEGLSGGEIKNSVLIALSEAANRKDAERVVRMSDLEPAITHVLSSKINIGSPHDGQSISRYLTSEEVKKEYPNLGNSTELGGDGKIR